MSRCLFAALCVLVLSPSLRADAVDEYVRAEMKRQKVPGLSLAVVHGGKVVKALGYGLANVEHGVPARRETVYQSGSVGKMFTAAAVMLLVQDGKLKLDDPIGKHLGGAPASWKAVTVRHLLNHTAGVKEYTRSLDLRVDYSEGQLLKKAFEFPIEFAPGTKWKYSNTGYAVLGILASRVAGRFYGDFLKERLFTPLGMKTARIISEADIIPHRAAGYRLVKGELKNQEWVSPTFNSTGDGSLYLTVDDLVRWDAGLDEKKVLTAKSLQEIWTPAKTADGKSTGYGFGWAVDEVNGHRRHSHGGAWQGFTTYFARYPDDRLTVIVLTNLAPGRQGSNPGKIAAEVVARYVPALAVKAKKK